MQMPSSSASSINEQIEIAEYADILEDDEQCDSQIDEEENCIIYF